MCVRICRPHASERNTNSSARVLPPVRAFRLREVQTSHPMVQARELRLRLPRRLFSERGDRVRRRKTECPVQPELAEQRTRERHRGEIPGRCSSDSVAYRDPGRRSSSAGTGAETWRQETSPFSSPDRTIPGVQGEQGTRNSRSHS